MFVRDSVVHIHVFEFTRSIGCVFVYCIVFLSLKIKAVSFTNSIITSRRPTSTVHHPSNHRAVYQTHTSATMQHCSSKHWEHPSNHLMTTLATTQIHLVIEWIYPSKHLKYPRNTMNNTLENSNTILTIQNTLVILEVCPSKHLKYHSNSLATSCKKNAQLPYRFPLANIYKGPHCNTMKPTHNILVSASNHPRHTVKLLPYVLQ